MVTRCKEPYFCSTDIRIQWLPPLFCCCRGPNYSSLEWLLTKTFRLFRKSIAFLMLSSWLDSYCNLNFSCPRTFFFQSKHCRRINKVLLWRLQCDHCTFRLLKGCISSAFELFRMVIQPNIDWMMGYQQTNAKCLWSFGKHCMGYLPCILEWYLHFYCSIGLDEVEYWWALIFHNPILIQLYIHHLFLNREILSLCSNNEAVQVSLDLLFLTQSKHIQVPCGFKQSKG